MSNYYDVTPKQVAREGLRWSWIAGIALVLFVGLIVGGWQLGWFFTAHNNARNNRLIQNGYANQTGLQSEIVNDIATVNTITVQMDGTSGQQLADLHAQRLAAAGDACLAASKITTSFTLGSAAAWAKVNCADGVVSLASPLRK